MSFWARVLTAVGFAPAQSIQVRAVQPRATRGRVLPDLSIWNTFQRIGGGITPATLSTIIQEADYGDIRRLIDTFNTYKQKDAHLQSILLTSEEAVAGLDWALVLPEKAKARDKRAMEWCEEQLRKVDGLSRLLAHQASSRAYMFSVSETLWTKESGRVVPIGFEYHAHRRFAFRQSDARLVWRDDNMPNDGVDFREKFPGKFIVSQPRVTGDVAQREGLIRVLLWAALFRNWDLADWMKLAEIAWKPWRLGSFEKEAAQEDIDNLTDILEGLTSSGVGVHPIGTKVDVKWPTGGSGGRSAHSELFERIAAEMSKVVLGQTLTTEQGNTGSHALGNVQNEVRKDLREATARHVAADITRDLIAPMVRMNFGPAVAVPSFVLLTEDAEDIEKIAKAVSLLAGAGLVFSSSWARDKLGADEPKDGDETFGGTPEPEPEATPPKPGDKPANGTPADGEEKPETVDDGEEPTANDVADE